MTVSDLEFLSHHLSTGTKNGYGYAFNKFVKFCSNLSADPFTCTPVVLVKYIRFLFEEGASYSTVNFHRSCVAKFHYGIDGISIGKHHLVSQAVKAVFRLRPPLPRYSATYDISVVFSYLKTLVPNETLPLKLLTLKTLFLLTSAVIFRVSSVRVCGSDITFLEEHCVIPLLQLEKQSRPNHVRGYVKVRRYEDPDLCPVQTLSVYVNQVSL